MEKIKIEWITEEGKIDNSVVKWAETTGEALAKHDLTTSTIRRFFGEMRRIQSNFKDNKEDVPLLRAKLAYDVGRKYNAQKGKGIGVKEFLDVLTPGIEAVDGDEKRFTRFVKITEALVAFHRQHNKADD